jgi:hypothetical protein
MNEGLKWVIGCHWDFRWCSGRLFLVSHKLIFSMPIIVLPVDARFFSWSPLWWNMVAPTKQIASHFGKRIWGDCVIYRYMVHVSPLSMSTIHHLGVSWNGVLPIAGWFTMENINRTWMIWGTPMDWKQPYLYIYTSYIPWFNVGKTMP